MYRLGGTGVRRLVDLLLVALLIVLMGHSLTGNTVHEWLGLVFGAVLVVHNLFNVAWYRRILANGIAARVSSVVNVLLLASIAVLLASGVLISRAVFPFATGEGSFAVRQLHVSAGCWFLVLAALHFGIHWRRAVPVPIRWQRALRSQIGLTLVRVAALGIVAIGLKEFFAGSFVPRMFFRDLFGDFVLGETWGRFALRYVVMIGAFAISSHYIAGSLRRCSTQSKGDKT